MRIPEVREMLLSLATDLRTGLIPPDEAADLVELLVPELIRRPKVRSGRAKARTMNDEIRRAVRADLFANPDAIYREIARRHDIDAGRVSEIAAGFRE